MVLQEREKNILAGLCVVAVICVYWFLLRPSGIENHELKQEITKYQKELRDPSVDKKKVEDMQDVVNALTKELKIISAQIPATEKRGFLIRDLEELAKKNNIELVSFLPKEAVPVTMAGKEVTPRMRRIRRKSQELEEQHAKVLKTVINIDSKGKFKNYNKFFADVLTYYRAVEVSDLIIAKGATATGLGGDKRFSRKRSKDPLAEAKNTELNVSFTLLAYTAIGEQ